MVEAALRSAASEVRVGAAVDAVDGVLPAWVARPASTSEVSAVLRTCTERDLFVTARGGGSKLGWGAPPRAVDVLLDLSALTADVEHAAGDLVVRVSAGTSLAALARLLATAGQRLALDPPEESATVGGVVATNACGPSRLLHGRPRDLLLGVTVVLADGTVARAGGRVVKNVAGYDLMKLFAGSFGTLGVVTECVLRLHPRPEARAVLALPARTPDAVPAAVRAVQREQVVPTAVDLVWPDVSSGPGTVVVVVEGTAAGVGPRIARLRAAVGDGEVVEAPPAGFGHRPWTAGGTGLTVACTVSGLGAALDALRAAGCPAGVRGSAGAGVLDVGLPAMGAGELTPLLRSLRRAVAPYDGSVVVRQAAPQTKAEVDVWGPVPALELMRRVKARFDPDGRLSPGRFVGGL